MGVKTEEDIPEGKKAMLERRRKEKEKSKKPVTLVSFPALLYIPPMLTSHMTMTPDSPPGDQPPTSDHQTPTPTSQTPRRKTTQEIHTEIPLPPPPRPGPEHP